MDWVYNHHSGQLKQSNSDWGCFTFQRTVDCVFNNRDSSSGKLIKPHVVEGRTLVEDIYFNQKPLSPLLNASEIRQIEYCRTYRH
jgi:hypothetical protein